MTDRRYKSNRHAHLEFIYPSEPMNYRINYTPRPAVRITWWRRALRVLLDKMT